MVEKMKKIQNDLLEFLEDESDSEEKYENFIDLLSTQRIINNRYEFKSLLQLINSIGDNHYRDRIFIFKIERLLRHLRMKSNNIFQIPKYSKFSQATRESFYFLSKKK